MEPAPPSIGRLPERRESCVRRQVRPARPERHDVQPLDPLASAAAQPLTWPNRSSVGSTFGVIIRSLTVAARQRRLGTARAERLIEHPEGLVDHPVDGPLGGARAGVLTDRPGQLAVRQNLGERPARRIDIAVRHHQAVVPC